MKWLVLAQSATDPTGGLGDIVATYGPFAPFAALLLWLLKLLWADNKAKEEEIRRLTEAAMEKVIPLVLEATSVLSEAVEALRRVQEDRIEGQHLDELMDELLVAVTGLHSAIKTANRRATPKKRARKKAQ